MNRIITCIIPLFHLTIITAPEMLKSWMHNFVDNNPVTLSFSQCINEVRIEIELISVCSCCGDSIIDGRLECQSKYTEERIINRNLATRPAKVIHNTSFFRFTHLIYNNMFFLDVFFCNTFFCWHNKYLSFLFITNCFCSHLIYLLYHVFSTLYILF